MAQSLACLFVFGLASVGCGGLARDESSRESPAGETAGGSGGGGAPAEPEPAGPEPFVGPPAVSFGEFNQSCEGAAFECQGESCCAHIEMPGGEFVKESTVGSTAAVRLQPFAMDKYEVTRGRFWEFVQSGAWPPPEGAGTHPAVPGSGWLAAWNERLPETPAAGSKEVAEGLCRHDPWVEPKAGTEAYGVDCVPWEMAFAFCIWDGKRLPTAAEWEFMAVGGDEQRVYPWGDVTPEEPCEFGEFYSCSQDVPYDERNYLVGRFPHASARWGHLDVLGNMWWEWVRDEWDGFRYEPEVDPLVLTAAMERPAARGLESLSEVAVHNLQPGAVRDNGFRCASPAL